jgi:hypothetical protein
MITIIHKGIISSYETSPGNSISYQGGMIATFVQNRAVGICNDKSMPIGFFMEDFNNCESFGPPCITILMGQGEYQTDIFEKSKYHINDFLYCSSNGKITNEVCYRGNVIVGIVNCVLGGIIGFFSIPPSRGLDLETFQIKTKIEEVKEKSKSKTRWEILKNS